MCQEVQGVFNNTSTWRSAQVPTSAAFSQIQWIQYQVYAKKNMLLLTKVSRTRFATPAWKENWLFARKFWAFVLDVTAVNPRYDSPFLLHLKPEHYYVFSHITTFKILSRCNRWFSVEQ